MRNERTRRRSRSRAGVDLLFLATFLFAACGEGAVKDEMSTSGLPGEFQLRALSDENREVFCEWYESVVPSEEDCPRDTQEGEAPPTCLEKFEHFGNCTVAEVESCIASASASACELPDTEACRAFQACQEEAAPANDCPDRSFVCKAIDGPYKNWKGEGQTWGTCWSWWPPGCERCHGKELTWLEAATWCEEKYPTQCGSGHCVPDGDGYRDHTKKRI